MGQHPHGPIWAPSAGSAGAELQHEVSSWGQGGPCDTGNRPGPQSCLRGCWRLSAPLTMGLKSAETDIASSDQGTPFPYSNGCLLGDQGPHCFSPRCGVFGIQSAVLPTPPPGPNPGLPSRFGRQITGLRGWGMALPECLAASPCPHCE